MAWRVTSARDLPPAVEAALREQGEMIDLVWARQQEHAEEHAAEPSPAAADGEQDRGGGDAGGGWGFWRGFSLALMLGAGWVLYQVAVRPVLVDVLPWMGGA